MSPLQIFQVPITQSRVSSEGFDPIPQKLIDSVSPLVSDTLKVIQFK